MAKLKAVCMSTNPYDKMHDYVNMDAFDYFEEDSEEEIDLPTMVKMMNAGNIGMFIDYRMCVLDTDFPDRQSFIDFVLKRYEKQEGDNVRLCTYDVHFALL